jgi:hypothetical protein
MAVPESLPIRSDVLRRRESLRDVVCPLLIILFAAAHPHPALATPGRTAAESHAPAESQSKPVARRQNELFGVQGDVAGLRDRGFRSGTEDTLWIFDADFEDLTGDNAGWLSLDMSGTLGHINYWHKDTVRTGGFPHLGDSVWWCGSYNDCWRQPRGYGNNWLCHLVREFPLSVWSAPGDFVTFEWDQRFAIENDYDYGYVDVASEGDSTWVTLASFDNPGFAGTPGTSTDWNHGTYGHWSLDMSVYAGADVTVRFRLESDGANSSQDAPDNPPMHSFRDGAWQLDNLEFAVNDSVRWFDDCESPGSNGWAHEDIPTTGQVGVIFERVYRPDTFRNCLLPGWWMAAVDSVTGRVVDGQASWLVSPPIDISGAEALIGQYDFWKDCPRPTNDRRGIWLASNDDAGCVQDLDGFEYYFPGEYPMDPLYGTWTNNWDFLTGKDWLSINWRLWNTDPGEYHMTGLMLGRQRVGVPVGGAGTRWYYGQYGRFRDTFDIDEALSDTAWIDITDDDGVVSASLVVSSNGGATWEALPMIPVDPEGTGWLIPPPVSHIAPATEIRYYFEALDGAGDLHAYPLSAPDSYYEFSILPINGSIEEPAVLLVDKYGSRAVPGADGGYRHTSEYYFREALDVIGFEYDVYDAEGALTSGGGHKWDGPDTSGMKYYDTQIWFAGESGWQTVTRFDQRNLVAWLAEAASGAQRNLMLSGNDIGYELVWGEEETLGFYTEWLASEYLENCAGSVYDTVVFLTDAPGGFNFMTHDDASCHLHLWDEWQWCGRCNYFDVVQPGPGADGAELALEYVTQDLGALPAGVAYTHPAMGYQTVNLGFGIEFMMGEAIPTGKFESGLCDRSDLMANIMEYFGKEPTAPGTGADEGGVFATRLNHARPNPFNPRTTIDYSVAAPGRVTVRVYDLAGRVVRTLVDRDVKSGEHKVVWDGTTDVGQRAASGVYFVKMETAGHTGAFHATRKLVLLK